MKNNTKEIRESLKKILSNFPDDFALNSVKHYIKLAVSKIEDVEKARLNREKSSNIRKEKLKQKSQILASEDIQIGRAHV